MHGRSIGLSWICVALLISSACDDASERSDAADVVARTPFDFVGGDRCAVCHQAEHVLWRGSHHDLAMQEATESTVLGDFDEAELTYAGITTHLFRRGDDFLVETDGPTGDLEEFRIAYTFGVEPLQQYLIEFPDGRLQALSICWDARPAVEGGQRWFHLYPGEGITHDDPLHWTGLRQNWNFMCAECHSTALEKNYDPDADRYSTTWSEIDVSCEACHGPGSRHVAWAEARESGEPVDDSGDLGLRVVLKDRGDTAWVIDPETGIAVRSVPRTSRAQLETCARCHSRRSVLATEYDHGRPLTDTHRPALLEEGLYHPDGQILDEVYVYGSFLQSKMHAAGVTCGDCHDPHSARLTLGDADAACSRCHLASRFASPEHHFHEPGTRGASCVECHMPSRDYMVIDPRRDHSFRIPRPELSVELGTPNACNDCHADRSAEWALAAVDEWYGAERIAAPGYPRALGAARAGAVNAETLLAGTVTQPGEPAIARATAIRLLANHAGTFAADAIARALGDGDPLVRAAAATGLEALPPGLALELGAPLLEDPIRLVRVNAARSLAAIPRNAMAPLERDALAAALEEYRQEQLANFDRPEANANLGALEALLGDQAAAKDALRRALALDPSYLPAYVNLADLYRAEGRDREGEALLRQALDRQPGAASVRNALGLLLVRQQKTEAALEELERAAVLEPEVPLYAYAYGVALHSTGDIEGALRVLGEAHLRRPGDRSLLQALATIGRDAGAHEQALGHARSLERLSPGDPGVRDLVTQLERLVSRQRKPE